MKWRKLGLVWEPPGDIAWARTHAFLPTADVLDPGRIRVYCTVLDDQLVGRVVYVDVAPNDPTSVLSVAQAPVFDIGELGCFDDQGVNASCVIDWRGSRWMYYIGWQHAVRVPYMLFTGLARSTDGGESFHRAQRVPALDRIDEEPFLRAASFVLIERDRLRMWYVSCRYWTPVEGGPPHYNNEINCAESADGTHWNVLRRGCVVTEESDDYSVGRPWVVRDGSLYRMWFSTRSANPRWPYRIEYAESADGLTWTRRDAGIEPSTSGWDSEMICYPSVVDAGGRRLLFYNGNRRGLTGFGVAELESD